MDYRVLKLGKLAVVLVIVAALGGAVMVLWNAVLPALFDGSRTIDYWHALGLLVLCRILFGGFRGRGAGLDRERWQKWQKWQSMSKEERAQFRQGRADWCRPRSE